MAVVNPRRVASSASVSTRRVLPMPLSPTTKAVDPEPLSAAVSASTSELSSLARPTRVERGADVECEPGTDGCCRRAGVDTPRISYKERLAARPLARLYSPVAPSRHRSDARAP